jgi:chromosomal replication initiator protein
MAAVDLKQLWENVLLDIELSVSKANFNTWFKGSHIVKEEDGVIYVGVPSQFYKDWLADKHHKTILRSIRNFLPEARGVEYVISKERPKEAERPAARSIQVNELPLSDVYINRIDNLNPRYTFENFIVGPFNEVAHAASQAIVQNPGITYNPLFVYGSTGYGKTHLIQAIGNQLKRLYPNKKVYYVTSEKFGTDYVTALQQNNIQAIKDKYRNHDVLIMDDIQFMAGREKTQEELFHLFNSLYENNRQIIFSSDKHPNYIQNLEERLKSRFGQGMIIDISPPDHESRVAILRAKSSHYNFHLPDDMAEYVAGAVEGNIRDLEGVLNRIICQTQLKGATLTVADLRNLVKDSAKPQKAVSIKDVVRRVAEFYDIDESSIYEKTRKKEVVKPRQLIMYLMREDYSVSYPAIGEKLGGRDHTTVIHSCEKVKQDLLRDPGLQQEIDQIRVLLK